MQIKPHQIKHFAEQQRRLRRIRYIWNLEAEEEGSYFSNKFKKGKLTVELSIDTTRFTSQLRKFEGECFYKVLNCTDTFNKIDEFLNVNGFNSEE